MPGIINRGRGPEIEGTRITVYDILDYLTDGWHHTAIAATLRLSSAEVLAAIEYIEANKEEVLSSYQKLLERSARGNPPELQAKLDAIQAECQGLWAERRQQPNPQANHEGNSRGQQRPGTP